jgi:hypothetical protein
VTRRGGEAGTSTCTPSRLAATRSVCVPMAEEWEGQGRQVAPGLSPAGAASAASRPAGLHPMRVIASTARSTRPNVPQTRGCMGNSAAFRHGCADARTPCHDADCVGMLTVVAGYVTGTTCARALRV